MNMNRLLKKSEKVVIDNSPAILTAIGVTGTVMTAYLAGKASFKAAEILRNEEFKRNIGNSTVVKSERITLENKERVKLLWKLYIPAAGAGLLTIGAILGANHIGTRRAAAVAAAYSITERAYAEYKDKVIEKFGETKEQAVRDELAQDRVRNNPPTEQNIIITPGVGDVLCRDEFSGRYFKCNMETLKKAQNDINYQILSEDSASVTDFYNKIGLPETSVSGDLGWNTGKKLELLFSHALADDGTPCLTFDFGTVPFRRYWQY